MLAWIPPAELSGPMLCPQHAEQRVWCTWATGATVAKTPPGIPAEEVGFWVALGEEAAAEVAPVGLGEEPVAPQDGPVGGDGVAVDNPN